MERIIVDKHFGKLFGDGKLPPSFAHRIGRLNDERYLRMFSNRKLLSGFEHSVLINGLNGSLHIFLLSPAATTPGLFRLSSEILADHESQRQVAKKPSSFEDALITAERGAACFTSNLRARKNRLEVLALKSGGDFSGHRVAIHTHRKYALQCIHKYKHK